VIISDFERWEVYSIAPIRAQAENLPSQNAQFSYVKRFGGVGKLGEGPRELHAQGCYASEGLRALLRQFCRQKLVVGRK
jgi:hypothetical protein